MGQQNNPAQPLFDLYDKWTGKEKKPAPAPKPVDTSWHDEQVKKANDSFNKPKPTEPVKPQPTKVPSYKKGGIVRKTGLALVHKGEKVIPRKDVMRKRGGK